MIYSVLLFTQDGYAINSSSSPTRGACIVPLPVADVVQTFTVFVNKGDSIYFGVRDIARFNSVRSVTRWDSSDNSKLVFDLDDSPFIY